MTRYYFYQDNKYWETISDFLVMRLDSVRESVVIVCRDRETNHIRKFNVGEIDQLSEVKSGIPNDK